MEKVIRYEEWLKQECEIKERPEKGEEVQFAVLHILQLRRLNIPTEEVKFFMRKLRLRKGEK